MCTLPRTGCLQPQSQRSCGHRPFLRRIQDRKLQKQAGCWLPGPGGGGGQRRATAKRPRALLWGDEHIPQWSGWSRALRTVPPSPQGSRGLGGIQRGGRALRLWWEWGSCHPPHLPGEKAKAGLDQGLLLVRAELGREPSTGTGGRCCPHVPRMPPDASDAPFLEAGR